jgi:uncharacterized surface protein with fasciclin (FAS1) repeats
MKFASSLALIAATLIASTQVNAADNTLAQALAANPELSTLNTAVQASGLAETLTAAPAITVFAPTNAAFAALPAGTVESLLKPEAKADLEALLKRHVVGTAYDLDSLKRKRSVAALAGNELRPNLVRGKLRLGEDVKLATRELRVANGYVIVIDRVLTP